MPRHKYPELARKIAAAVVSHVSGAESIDRFLEQNVPENVTPIWHDLAEEDPKGQSLQSVREIRDTIHERVKELIRTECADCCARPATGGSVFGARC